MTVPDKSDALVAKQRPLQAWLLLASYFCILVCAGVVVHAFVDRDAIEAMVDRSGVFGHLTFLLVGYIYVLFVPLYNTPVHLLGGYLFGGLVGWILNTVYTSAALFTIIVLVRHFGRSLITRVVPERTVNRYDSFVNRIGPIGLFVIYVAPLFPDDELTYLIAAGRVSFARYVLPVLLGTLGKTSVSYIGVDPVHGAAMALTCRVAVLAVGLIVISLQEFILSRLDSRVPREGTRADER